MIALYGTKIGMTQVFDKDGLLLPVTVIHIEPNVVVGDRSEEKNGYAGKILATFRTKPQRLRKPQLGYFKDKVHPRSKMFEVKGYADHQYGDEIGVEVFESIAFVDVTATSKGKGYQGVMKRHNASGGPAAHGSKFHRTGGSTGQSATPSRVRKGSKMAGHMGNARVTVQNLKIIQVNTQKGLLLVGGAVPGATGASVLVRNAKKKSVLV